MGFENSVKLEDERRNMHLYNQKPKCTRGEQEQTGLGELMLQTKLDATIRKVDVGTARRTNDLCDGRKDVYDTRKRSKDGGLSRFALESERSQ